MLLLLLLLWCWNLPLLVARLLAGMLFLAPDGALLAPGLLRLPASAAGAQAPQQVPPARKTCHIERFNAGND
jgi:hypothetical protein